METGQLVVTHIKSGTKILIARDSGHYDGTKPELNVRRLTEIAILDITLAHPTYQAIVNRGLGYGMGWGDTGPLYPISTDDSVALVMAHARATKARNAAEAVLDSKPWAPVPGTCRKCGTVCYGDCES